MASKRKRTVWQHIKASIGLALWLLLVVLTISGAFDVWEASGIALLVGSFAWSYALWLAFFWRLTSNMSRLDALESPWLTPERAMPVLGALLFLTSVGPGVAAGIKWGPGPGVGVALLGLSGYLSVLLSVLLVNLWKTADSRREDRERARFEAKFVDGPIGVWRADLPRCGIEAEPGCQLVFNSDGSGSVRQWDLKANEPNAPERTFHWRLIEEEVIDVVESLCPAYVRLRCLFLGIGGESLPRLLLHLDGASDLDLWVPTDSGFSQPGSAWWPEFFYFAFRGEPPTAESLEPRAA